MRECEKADTKTIWQDPAIWLMAYKIGHFSGWLASTTSPTQSKGRLKEPLRWAEFQFEIQLANHKRLSLAGCNASGMCQFRKSPDHSKGL